MKKQTAENILWDACAHLVGNYRLYCYVEDWPVPIREAYIILARARDQVRIFNGILSYRCGCEFQTVGQSQHFDHACAKCYRESWESTSRLNA